METNRMSDAVQNKTEGAENKEVKPPSYKELLAQVAVLAKFLNAHVEGKGKFDASGMLTRSVLDNVPEAANELVRKNQKMDYTLKRVKTSIHSLIAAQVLPSEGWDGAVKVLIDSIDEATQINSEIQQIFRS